MASKAPRTIQALGRRGFRPIYMRVRPPCRRVPRIPPTGTRWLRVTPAMTSVPIPPDPRENPAIGIAPHPLSHTGAKRFADFDLRGRVFIVTGGAQGLGLSLAEGLAEAGGIVYCLDRRDSPDPAWEEAEKRAVAWGGEFHYRQQDISDTEHLRELVEEIAAKHQHLDGLIAAAAIQQVTPAIEYSPDDVDKMMSINYRATFMTAQAAAREMMRYKCKGSICLIASMSGTIANKGLLCPVYNSSKAAVIQLARNLAMEWTPLKKDGTGGIRVNCISPGHIMTPMVKKNIQDIPGLKEKWESENMMGRLSHPTEFKGAALFLLSNASSFMTGGNLIVDGGHTAW
ncbi:NAD(P)-binding protein [Xylariomycetidae sp. FL2044]|nr:NAD(P)-binding protein [Xylariomycetidae sp. FL2044]